MEKLTLEQAVNEIAKAYAEFENAKSDRDDVIESALDSFFEDIPEGTPKKEIKAIKATRKTEIKNIKKLAKAMASGKKDEAKEEAEHMTELIETLGDRPF